MPTVIPVELARKAVQLLRDHGRGGRLARLHRRQRRGSQRLRRQRPAEDRRGTAAALPVPHRVAHARPPAADHPLALPDAALPHAAGCRCRARACRPSRPASSIPERVQRAAARWPAARCAARSRSSTRARSPSSSTSARRWTAFPRSTGRTCTPSPRGWPARANDAAFETAVETIFAWLSEQTQAHGRARGRRRLAPLAEVWDKIARSVRETDSYNLDRRALVLTLFTDLSDALRASRAG